MKCRGKKLDTIKIPKFFSPTSKFGKFPFLDNEFQDQQTVFLNSLSSCLAGFHLTVCLLQKQWTLGFWFIWYRRSFVISYKWLTIVLRFLTLPNLVVYSGRRNSFWLQPLGLRSQSCKNRICSGRTWSPKWIFSFVMRRRQGLKFLARLLLPTAWTRIYRNNERFDAKMWEKRNIFDAKAKRTCSIA